MWKLIDITRRSATLGWAPWKPALALPEQWLLLWKTGTASLLTVALHGIARNSPFLFLV